MLNNGLIICIAVFVVVGCGGSADTCKDLRGLAQQLRSDANYLDQTTINEIKKASGKQQKMKILLSSEVRSLKSLEATSARIREEAANEKLKSALLSIAQRLINLRKRNTEGLKKAIESKTFVLPDDPKGDADFVAIEAASRDFDQQFQAECSKNQ